MPDHSSETQLAPRRDRSEHRRERRNDWRLGGSTVRPWREKLLAIALLSLGAGVVLGDLARQFAPTLTLLPQVLLWLGMLAPVIVAFVWSRPVGLLRFRAIDLLWGLGLGLTVRAVQGWVAGADAAFPALTRVDGQLPAGWWFTDALAPAVIAPLIEEFFFHGVLLVAAYSMLRRALGGFTAGLTALLVTTAVFVVLHAALAPGAVSTVVALAVLGLTAGAAVLLTGRIWTAVLIHVVYNVSGVGLLLGGTFLA
ncbi:CPBP family intramembrane metalloprotease [Microbacterium sp. W1N]|uniref:CPBP family intramembrane glutamic endopeptidase n=1 Tax=Microbacterium festucae TaxID=2977531 RepID=UPI0021BEFE68|nr:CPBP family intramembrane glutamic endopeptidase [Microbacterium festucae]MCT9819022.1 CPBP family intramembrane metalloprotease [Microbacterium festucae]